MSKLERSGKFRPFRPWKITFRAIQSNPALGMISTILGKVLAKIEKKLLTSFWENCLKCKKGTNLDLLTFWPLKMTLRAIQPNPSYDMLLMSSQRSLMPKKREKLLKRFWDWPFRPLKLTPPPPPTTDESAFEKLRCHSGAKNNFIQKQIKYRSLKMRCQVIK